MKKILIVCTTDSMIWNFLVPHIREFEKNGIEVECACSETGDFFQKLLDLNIKLNKIRFERSPYKIKNITAYKSLVKLIKEKKFDTIFCHEPVGGAMGRLAGRKCNCKVVYVAHGFHFYKGAPKSRKIYYFIEKYLSQWTDVLITMNEEDYLAAKKFKAKKCYKINGIGVNISEFSNTNSNDLIRRELNLPENAVIFFSVGELSKRKNHEVVIKALSAVENNNLHFVIAGDGELREYLLHLIKELKLEGRVHLLGYRNDIKDLCNSADVFVLPSIHEGLSVALLEAMASGKPVIASEIRGSVDVIDENKGGYLVRTFDIDAYADRIKKFEADRGLIKQFGKYNFEKVKNYDVEIVKEQLMGIFAQL